MKVINMAEDIKTDIWGKYFTNDSKGRNWNLDTDGFPLRDREQAREMELLVLYGGPEVGMMTNPDRENRPNFIEVNGEKVVCRAQGGECRYQSEFYSPGLRTPESWRTPVIRYSCPDDCPYKCLVCDDHNHSPGEDIDVFIPYPHYNKFQGQFTRYCRDFDRIRQPVKDEEDPEEPGSDTSWR